MESLEKIHTTPLEIERIKRNLALKTNDVASWCKEKIRNAGENEISRCGKNWYVKTGGCIITVNARSCTIITAHKTENFQ